MPTFYVGTVILAIVTALSTRRRAVPMLDTAIVLIVIVCMFFTMLIFAYLFVIVASDIEQFNGQF